MTNAWRQDCINMKRSQQGDSLIEAVVAVLLIGIMALGLIYTTTQAERGHRDTKASGLAIAQMRNILQSNKIPDGDSDPSNDEDLTSECDSATLSNAITIPTSEGSSSIKKNLTLSCKSKSITVNGVSTSTKIIKLSTKESDTLLFGGILEVGEDD